jgi:hypothetical protein
MKAVSKLVGGLLGVGDQKIDNSAYERAAASQAAAEEAATNLQKNLAADLGTDKTAQVVASGTADQGTDLASTLRRRKSASGGLSSALGINA